MMTSAISLLPGVGQDEGEKHYETAEGYGLHVDFTMTTSGLSPRDLPMIVNANDRMV